MLLARALRVPHHARLARAGLDLLAVGRALLKHLNHALADVLRGNHRGPHGLAHRVELMVAGDLLDEGVTVLLEQHEVAQVVQKQLRLEEATHHRLQLHLQARPVVLVGDGAPGQHALRVGGE